MAKNRQEFLQKLLDGFRSNYDVETISDESLQPLKATAAYHEHSVSYLLIKSAQMWSADRHEFTYFFDVPVLTAEIYQNCIDMMLRLGEPLVKPDGQHMSSALVAIFICDSAEEDAEKALKKCRIKKSFQFSLQGWMEVQTAAVKLGNETVIANYPNCETAKYLKSLLRGRRRSGLGSFLEKITH